MTFAIFTHVPHIQEQNKYFGYAPYIREMNIWLKYVSKVVIIAPISDKLKSPIDLDYNHQNIHFVAIKSFDLLNFTSILKSFISIPKILLQIYWAMKAVDHIHLRCPGNIGLLACAVQILFPNKPKTAKYAGNWDPKAKQPWSYRLQKWILCNTFLTKNMQVLVYGTWQNQTKNIKPFFTATYSETDKKAVAVKDFDIVIKFLFVGTLAVGKRPMYAIQVIENLKNKGFDVSLDVYGDGIQKETLKQYVVDKNLENFIFFKGNQTKEVIKDQYNTSHFLILPSASEGWPKVVAEAMFWGCLPIATPVSCVPSMLDKGNRGILLEMQLEKDCHKIINLLQNQALYQNKAQQAIEWSRKYTTEFFESEIKLLLHP